MKGKKYILSEKDEKWLVAHFKNTANAEVAKRLGISETAVHRIARRLGLKKTPQYMRKAQQHAADRAKLSHLINGTYPPKGVPVPGGEKYRFQKGVSSLDRLGERRERERVQKAAASRRETMRQERARVVFGLQQQTRLRVKRQPERARAQRYYLNKRGYHVDRGSYIAYYDENTRRSRRYEERTRENSKRYIGFTYLPISEKEGRP